jgi:hypothetical protein
MGAAHAIVPSAVLDAPTRRPRCAVTWEWLKTGDVVKGENNRHTGLKETLQNEMTQGEFSVPQG